MDSKDLIRVRYLRKTNAPLAVMSLDKSSKAYFDA